MSMKFIRIFILCLVCLSTSGLSFGDELPKAAQRRFDYFYLEAVRMRNLGKYADAYELYKHALLINPDAPEALFDMASFCNYLGSKEETQHYYEKAAELAPQNSWYQQVLGNFYYRNNQIDKAIAVYEKMAENSQEKSEILYELLSLYTQKQDYEKCIWALNKLESLDGKSEQISMEKYRIFLKLEDKDRAFKEIEALADEYPNDYRYKVMLGDLYLDNNQPQRALGIYQGVLEVEPQNVLAQLSMVSYLEKQNEKEEATQALESLVLNPSLDDATRTSVMRKIIYNSEEAKEDSTHILNLFGQILEMPQGSADMAMLCTQYKVMKKMSKEEITTSLRQVVKLDPSNAGARLQLMQYAFEREDFNDAIQLCQEAIEYTPEVVAFYYYQGLSYFQSDRNDEALEVFKRSMQYINSETDVELASNIYGAMGDIYHEKKMNKEAYESYDSALVFKPDNVLVLNNYAYYLALEKKDLEKAEAMSFRTIKADPKSYNELDTYAWILFLEKKYTEARIYIEQSLKNGGESHSGIVEHAGDIFFVNGDLNKAMKYWQKADEMGADSKTLKKKIKQKKYIEE